MPKNKEIKEQDICPTHPGAPMMTLNDGFRRCAPIEGNRCKFTRPPKGGR